MKIGILGTGAYGLALAIALNKNKNNEIIMWTKLEHEKEEIETKHEYHKVLPGIHIPENIKITTNLEELASNSELIIYAIPAVFVDSISKELKEYFKDNQHICMATKGIEQDSCLFVDYIVKRSIDTDNISVISGPSFAIDTVSNMPIGLSIAGKNIESNNVVKKAFTNTNIKLRETDDIYGVEICGAIKNVIAIACGILDGLNANESTKAMFITDSLHDIKNLINKLGGNGRTILSYAGFGDLLLTCTSPKSRNFSFGQILATNDLEKIEEYKNNNTIEGLYTLKSIYQLVEKKQITIPIIELIYDIVFYNKDSNSLFTFLLEKE